MQLYHLGLVAALGTSFILEGCKKEKSPEDQTKTVTKAQKQFVTDLKTKDCFGCAPGLLVKLTKAYNDGGKVTCKTVVEEHNKIFGATGEFMTFGKTNWSSWLANKDTVTTKLTDNYNAIKKLCKDDKTEEAKIVAVNTITTPLTTLATKNTNASKVAIAFYKAGANVVAAMADDKVVALSDDEKNTARQSLDAYVAAVTALLQNTPNADAAAQKAAGYAAAATASGVEAQVMEQAVAAYEQLEEQAETNKQIAAKALVAFDATAGAVADRDVAAVIQTAQTDYLLADGDVAFANDVLTKYKATYAAAQADHDAAGKADVVALCAKGDATVTVQQLEDEMDEVTEAKWKRDNAQLAVTVVNAYDAAPDAGVEAALDTAVNAADNGFTEDDRDFGREVLEIYDPAFTDVGGDNVDAKKTAGRAAVVAAAQADPATLDLDADTFTAAFA